MNNLSVDIKTHVIITYAGGHYFITNKQNQDLMMVGQSDFIEIENNKIKGSSISEIMTIAKYYETYPQKKLESPRIDQFKKYEGLPDRIPTGGLKEVLKGLARYIAEEKGKGIKPYNAIVMYEKYELKQRVIPT